MFVKEDFIRDLREKRKEKSLSQATVAYATDYEVRSYQYVECGHHLPDLRHFLLLCNFHGLNPLNYLDVTQNSQNDSLDLS